MTKSIYAILAGLVIVMALTAFGCNFGTTSRYYFLNVINTGTEPIQLSVSLAGGPWAVSAGESKMIKIEKQKDAELKTPRVFTMKSKNGTKTAQFTLHHYSGHVVLDVTANNCLVAADYGPQYRGKDTALPEGKSDIEVVKVFKHEQVFMPETWDDQKGTFDFTIGTWLGDPLPDKLKTSTVTTIPKHVRLIRVPCEVVDDSKALYSYLNSN